MANSDEPFSISADGFPTKKGSTMEIKFPDVYVPLVGQDGNAFSIMGRVAAALRKAGHGDAVAAYQAEAMSGDYDNLLRVTARTVNIGISPGEDDENDWN